MADAITKKKRPVYLNLVRLSVDLPLPGIVSILHRISGAMLFFFLFLLLSLLQDSLASPQSFAAFRQTIGNPVVKLILLGLLWAYLHHLCAIVLMESGPARGDEYGDIDLRDLVSGRRKCEFPRQAAVSRLLQEN